MSSPGAMLRAAKAMPGAARNTPAPQGNSLGRYSPLAAQLQEEHGYASAYPTSFLQRPSETFTAGAFGPFSPILPTPVDQPPEGAERPEPRRWEYEPGWNLPSGQPGAEGLKLAPFSTLRTIADLYSVARSCIQLRKAEIRGLDWDIIPSHEAAKAYHGDRSAMKDFAERRAQMVKFFRHPDPDYFSFGTWLDAMLEEIFVYDALSILIRPKWGRGMGKGLLGSDLDSLELLSGPCYSDDTEVLTHRGWMKFSDVSNDDEFATRNPKTKELEWHHATFFHKEKWHGDLINFHGRCLDILVTPNHRMLTSSCIRKKENFCEPHGDEWIIRADQLAEHGGASQTIPCTSYNFSDDLSEFRVPSSTTGYNEYFVFNGDAVRTARKKIGIRNHRELAVSLGCSHTTSLKIEQGGTVRRQLAQRVHNLLGLYPVPHSDKFAFNRLSGDDFAAFMGMWLAEGCASGKRPTIYITQDPKSKGYTAYYELLKKILGRDPAHNGASFFFRHIGFAEYLKQFGHATDKFIPPEIFSLSARQTAIFWHYYWLGDGSAEAGRTSRISTSSRRMASDLQIIAQRMDMWATITTPKMPENMAQRYHVSLQKNKYLSWHAKKISYFGYVYCVSLPNETMYVRRNGKPSWCCNTIRPLVDLHGSIPRPPAPAYQQILFGVPRSDYMTLITQRDMEEGGLNDGDLNTYRGDQLLYLPMVPRRWTPYGFPPVERALIPIMSGLQKQAYQMAYFREGTVPEVYISPGDMNMTPNQLRELQDALNAFAGDPAWKHKIIVLPPGSKTEPMKTKEIADQFDEIVMSQVTMAFDVNPMEIGLLPRVSTVASPFAAREMAQSAKSIHERTSTKPLLKFIVDIFDNIMHRVCGQDDMKFTFEGLQEEDEANSLTQMLSQQVQFGIRSVDEARDELELEPWGLPETSGPVFFGATGPIPFGQVAVSEDGGVPGTPPGQTEETTESNETFNNVAQPQDDSQQTNDLGPELTPAHMAAQAFMDQPSASPGGGSPSDNAKVIGVDLTRAQRAEIEALTRQIQKGRDPSTWQSRTIPRFTPSLVYSELSKGTSAADVHELISQIILGNDSYNWNFPANVPVSKNADPSPPKNWPGWKYDLQLAKIYAKRLRGAFTKAIHRSSVLLREWWAGDIVTTRQGLVHMIGEILEKDIGIVLTELWTEAWYLGDKSGEAVQDNRDPDFGAWLPGNPGSATSTATTNDLQNLLNAYGIQVVKSLADSRLNDLSQAITDTIAKGNDVDSLIEKLPSILLVHARSGMIARTEVARAITAATQARFRDQGVIRKAWETAPDDVCPICMDNKAEGPIPSGSLFKSGAPGPPAHPHCRCVIMPADNGQATQLDPYFSAINKRRRVDIHGQLLPDAEAQIYHSEPGAGFSGNNVQQPPNPSGPGWGGGGQQMRPHDATGTQYEDIPGASWGSEPPRWDYSTGPGDTNGGAFASGDLNRIPDADLWPEGGHGTEQSPGEWDVQAGRNPFYGITQRTGTDFEDESDPHSRDDEDEEVPEDEDDAKHPGFPRGRAPNAVGKAKDGKPWNNKKLPLDERIYQQLTEDYPPEAINWVRHVTWKEPVEIPVSKIDFSNEDSWHASKDLKRLEEIHAKIKGHLETGKHGKPLVLVKSPGNPKYIVIDGHHRALMYRKLKSPAWAYVALVSKNKGPWLNTHHMQDKDSPDMRNVRKNASNYSDANPVESEHVMNQMRINYPEDSIEWMKDAHWIGPVKVPLDRVDFADAGRWAAFHQENHVENFKKLIQEGDPLHPVVAVQIPDDPKVKVVDGHHRALAYKELNKPVVAYVGIVHSKKGPWDKTHLYQVHQGSDPRNKGKKGKPKAAGIVVRAKDSGRILMLQRHLD